MIEELRELTNKLPELPILSDIISDVGSSIYTKYEVENGTSLGFALLNKPEVAVQELFLTKNSIFPTHKHIDEIEVGVIYKGSILVNVEGVEHKLSVGDIIKFNKNEAHSGIAIEDTWMIAISTPRIDGYPN